MVLGFWVAGYELRVAIYELRVSGWVALIFNPIGRSEINK